MNMNTNMSPPAPMDSATAEQIPTLSPMTEPIRRRRRPALSCLHCRQRKLRCDRNSPCSNCAKIRETCVFERFPGHRRPSPGPRHRFNPDLLAEYSGSSESDSRRQPSTSGWPPAPTAVSNAKSPAYPSPASNTDVDSIKGAIRDLEGQLQRATRTSELPAQQHLELAGMSSAFAGGAFYSHREGPANVRRPRGASRSVWHKTRLFGQSHWINGIVDVQDIFELIDHGGDDAMAVLTQVQKCKTLARIIKAGQMPEWPNIQPTELPSRELADLLITNYLETYESMFRILHLPTFRREYDAFWSATESTDDTFVLLLKQVLAIGAATFDDTFSLRTTAIGWMLEAHVWLSKPNFKSRLNLRYLQIHILNLFAREATGVGDDFVWANIGTLSRMAMMMGLHRDPKHLPRSTLFEMEMRRRLWSTIMEMSLRASMTTGGQLLMPQYDTEAPGNYNDDELLHEEATSRGDDEFTDMTVALALRQTFPLRVRIVRFLNEIDSTGTYEETIALDTAFRKAYKDLRQALNTASASGHRGTTDFQLRALDYIMSRYLLALHVPCFSASMYEKEFAYSRSVVVDTALKIWAAAYPSVATTDTAGAHGDKLAQLIMCASGFYRVNAIHVAILLALDLRAETRREDTLGPVSLRRDLLAVLEEANTWHLQTIKAGENSCKGYLCNSVLRAQVHALTRGASRSEQAQAIMVAGRAAMEKCMPILEQRAAMYQPEVTLADIAGDMPTSLGDWNFFNLDGIFDFGDIGAVDYGSGDFVNGV